MSGALTGIPGFAPKDPDDRDQFFFDFTAILQGSETITDAVGVVEQVSPPVLPGMPPLVPGATAIIGSLVTLWLSGGLESASYDVGILIDTSAGRTLRRSATLFVGRC